MSERRILGIDPGMARTGYGVVIQGSDGRLDLVACGVITTPAGQALGDRLLSLEDGIAGIIEQHRPATAGVEKLFFERNVSTAMSVGQARGVAMLTLARCKVEVAEYAPAEIKQAVAGYGAADKRQMQIMVQRLLRMDAKPTPDDVADALAIAICHAHASRTMARLEAGG
ncbi:MAG TPA: crossover junction endodeoxyribonuclease RuvC [Anaerolineales bacterium]|nr:crossover junction endodeoxyribonuclease RuvC [Anaerolineales bacterium]